MDFSIIKIFAELGDNSQLTLIRNNKDNKKSKNIIF